MGIKGIGATVSGASCFNISATTISPGFEKRFLRINYPGIISHIVHTPVPTYVSNGLLTGRLDRCTDRGLIISWRASGPRRMMPSSRVLFTDGLPKRSVLPQRFALMAIATTVSLNIGFDLLLKPPPVMPVPLIHRRTDHSRIVYHSTCRST